MASVNGKRLRGCILRCLGLSRVIPDLKRRESMSTEAIADFLRGARIVASAEALERELAYLEERGYVNTERLTGRAAILQPGVLAWITAKGVDVLEGTVADPGVYLPGNDGAE
jgi:hypothetical protein